MNHDPADESDDGVLTPDELESSLDDDRVDRVGEHRYVIRPDRPAASAGVPTAAIGLEAGGSGDAPATNTGTGADAASAAIGASAPVDALANAPDPHGIDVTLKTDGELAHLRTTSHDVREVFRELLTWYANQLDEDLTPTQALEVMLRTTELDG